MADPLLTIDAGENLLLTLTVRDENGTAVNLNTVTEATFWLGYYKPAKVLKAWTYRNPDTYSADMQAPGGTGVLELELLPTETARPGKLKFVTNICFTDSDYFSSGHLSDVVITEDFLEIAEVMPYLVPLEAADAENYDDELGDNNDDLLVG